MLRKNYREHLENDIDIENVLKYNDLSYRIVEEMEKATEKTIEFWQEVKSTNDTPKMYEAAIEIANSIRNIKSLYFNLNDNLGFKMINFYKLYCDFLEKIIFHEEDANDIRDKLNSLQSDNDQLFQNEKEYLVNDSLI